MDKPSRIKIKEINFKLRKDHKVFLVYNRYKGGSMKITLLLILLGTCLSCSKYATVSKDSVGVQISSVKMDVSHLNEIPWQVGTNREEKITQSITFIMDLPKLKKDDLMFLSEQKNVDSWIVRVIAKRNSETQDLGSLYSIFQPRHSSRTSSSTASKVAIKIYYAAGYASERFRSFKCPAFGHDKKIDEMFIAGNDDEFEIHLAQSTSYGEKSQLVDLNPSAFNGGNSLVGEYWLEIAPYDSKNKMIHGPFKRIPRHVVVKKETIVPVKSCDGIKMEYEH